MISKYASWKNNELKREIEAALQRGDTASYESLLQEVLSRQFK